MTIVYRCDGCSKERYPHRPESWHEVEIATLECRDTLKLHFCVECMTDKKEWREPAQ